MMVHLMSFSCSTVVYEGRSVNKGGGLWEFLSSCPPYKYFKTVVLLNLPLPSRRKISVYDPASRQNLDCKRIFIRYIHHLPFSIFCLFLRIWNTKKKMAPREARNRRDKTIVATMNPKLFYHKSFFYIHWFYNDYWVCEILILISK